MQPIGTDSGDGRLAALLETMRAFAEAATDYQLLLDTITEQVTGLLGEGCSIYLTTDDGEGARPVALANRSEIHSGVVRSHFGDQTLPLEGAGVVARAIREGRTVRIPVLDARTLARNFRPEDVATLARLELRSLLVVPLQVRARIVGALAISRHGANDTPFDAEDEVFAQTLANHAALALRNAQLLESVQRELQERKKAEQETKKFVALVQRSRDFVAMASFDGRILFINDAGRELLGIAPDHDLGDVPLSAFHTDDGMKRAEVLHAVGHWQGEGQLRHFGTGELIPTQVSSLILRSLENEPLCFATVQRDLRETRRLEERLRQAQKMEAIGQLAGGVAHDFNNLLSVILGYSYLLLDALDLDSHSRAGVSEIQKAGERGAGLTQQLLAFSRQQLLEPRVVDLNQVVRGMSEMLLRLLGEDVELDLSLDQQLGKILVDPGQIEQVVLNLAVNARDAMPTGGRLWLSTGNIEVAERRATSSGLPAGSYVMLSIRDTGMGMDPETTSRIFEPFFTTKPRGKGTGLGLSTVFGIVKQSRGHVVVTSALGEGTAFDIYVPCTDQQPTPSVPARVVQEPRGSETILLVEDDSQLRTLMSSVLAKAGYHVLQAADPVEALLHAEQTRDRIDLLLTDVVMPKMSGRDLVRLLAKRRVLTKVLYVSGYAEEALGRHGVLDPGIALLRKPVTPGALQRRVREVLDDQSRAKDFDAAGDAWHGVLDP